MVIASSPWRQVLRTTAEHLKGQTADSAIRRRVNGCPILLTGMTEREGGREQDDSVKRLDRLNLGQRIIIVIALGGLMYWLGIWMLNT